MNIYVLFAIVVPVAMFFSGFIIARQFRSLQNVPFISLMFVKYRWALSILTGIGVSTIFFLVALFDTTFSAWDIVIFITMASVASAFYYLGESIGWGNPTSVSKNVAQVDQASIDATFPENLIVEDLLNSVKITIYTKKRWGFFVMEVFQWIVIGLCLLPIAGLAAISFLQNYLPESFRFLVWLVVAGLVLYLLYTKFMEALEFIFDKEVIEVDHLSVRIEKYGSKFSSKKEFSAENIKGMTSMFSFGETNTVIRRSPFVNSNMPAFMMWHNRGLKRYHAFGRAVDLADAQRILEMIYAKFPQYKG